MPTVSPKTPHPLVRFKPKEFRFLRSWVEQGDPAQALREAGYRLSREKDANRRVQAILEKCDRYGGDARELFSMTGLGIGYVMRRLRELAQCGNRIVEAQAVRMLMGVHRVLDQEPVARSAHIHIHASAQPQANRPPPAPAAQEAIDVTPEAPRPVPPPTVRFAMPVAAPRERPAVGE